MTYELPPDWDTMPFGALYETLTDRHRKQNGPLPTAQIEWADTSTWDDIEPPPQEWVLHERIPARQCTLFSGEGAAGKSTVALHMAAAATLGKDCLQSVFTTPGPAFFIDAEDEINVMHRRLSHIVAHYQTSFKILHQSGLRLLPMAGKDAVMATAQRGKIEPTSFYRQILDAAADMQPRLVVVASAANVFAGSEIDRTQVTQFIGLLTEIAIQANGAVVLLSHPSLTGISNASGISGSTQWHNAVRARLYLHALKGEPDEPPDSDLRILEFKKNQYGPVSDTLTLRYRNGMFLPEGHMNDLEKIARADKVETTLLAMLDRFEAVNRTVSPAKSRTYLPRVFAAEPEAKADKITLKEFEEAMTALFARKALIVRSWGPPSKLKEFIARA
jgi:RecA-family ATPase